MEAGSLGFSELVVTVQDRTIGCEVAGGGGVRGGGEERRGEEAVRE